MQMQRELHALAAWCSNLVALTIREDTEWSSTAIAADAFPLPTRTTCVEREMPRLQAEWSKWRMIYVEEYASMSSIGPAGSIEVGAQVMCELTHLWGLICRPAHLNDMHDAELSIARLRHPSWMLTIHSYGKPDEDSLPFPWEVPIENYTQAQSVFAAMFLSQHFGIMQESCASEFHAAFDALWYRVAVLSQECHGADVLDDRTLRQCVLDTGGVKDTGVFITNAAYRQFCHCYLGSLMRALFYHDELYKRRLPTIILHTNCQPWIARIVQGMASEAFEDMYVACSDEAYQCLGDDAWFKYVFPNKVHSRAECLYELRPHLYQPFFSENKTTKAAVLAKYNENRVARLFVLKAISSYMQARCPGEFDWFLTVVRDADDLTTEASVDFQLGQQAPLLYGALGYWPYHGGSFYVCDDLGEAIGVWFALCERHYGCKVCERDMRPFLVEAKSCASEGAAPGGGANTFFIE